MEKINCGSCGMLLYFGEEISRRPSTRSIPSEETVLEYYHNTCPRCGEKLTLDTIDVQTEKPRKGQPPED